MADHHDPRSRSSASLHHLRLQGGRRWCGGFSARGWEFAVTRAARLATRYARHPPKGGRRGEVGVGRCCLLESRYSAGKGRASWTALVIGAAPAGIAEPPRSVLGHEPGVQAHRAAWVPSGGAALRQFLLDLLEFGWPAPKRKPRIALRFQIPARCLGCATAALTALVASLQFWRNASDAKLPEMPLPVPPCAV